MFSLKSLLRISVILLVYAISLASLAPVGRKNSADLKLLDGKTWTKWDTKTLEQMSTPRCGVKDKTAFDSNSRSKRYVLHKYQRPYAKKLTYNILKYSNQLNEQQIDEEIARAFDVWSEYVNNLTFTKKHEGAVDIGISFEEYDHGDGSPFDGPMGIMAHAGLLEAEEDTFEYEYMLHFDDSEHWTVDGSSDGGENLFHVAVHEIGHILGLGHSNERSSIMYPYLLSNSNFRLDADDIQGIQALYGSKS